MMNFSGTMAVFFCPGYKTLMTSGKKSKSKWFWGTTMRLSHWMLFKKWTGSGKLMKLQVVQVQRVSSKWMIYIYPWFMCQMNQIFNKSPGFPVSLDFRVLQKWFMCQMNRIFNNPIKLKMKKQLQKKMNLQSHSEVLVYIVIYDDN